MRTEAACIRIAGRSIGAGHPAYLVAELSANHRGTVEEAAALVLAAREAGADAVKLQTYTPDTITIDCDGEAFRHRAGSLWTGRTLHELYREAHTPWEWQPRLKAIADGLGIALFSTAFDPTAVEFLERMGVPAHKVASLEITDLPLIRLMGATRKPLIISTGMATLDEIAEAVDAARGAGARQIALLRCASAYPARPEDMRLRAIPDLAARTGLPVGLSDHTLGSAVPVAAVALGACIVEKHFTRSRAVPGPDSAFSTEPSEFREMVRAVRDAEAALGEARYGPGPHESETVRFRRSLWTVEDVAAGEAFTERNVRSIRPAGGLSPKHLSEVLGKRAARAAARGTPLSWDLVAR